MDADLTTQLNEQRRKVDFDTYDMSVRELVSMVVAQPPMINISPTYQRQFRWDEARQSSLIESVFLGIPIPSLYMAANTDNTWELIDGVQRLSTLVNFAGGYHGQRLLDKDSTLRLSGLEKLSLFNKLRFEDLPQSAKNLFLLKPMKITTISDKSDLQVRFDLFERLNTGGVVLTPQEIRCCVHRGRFSEYLRSMAQLEDFHRVVHMSKRRELDGTREECVLRFFAYLHDYRNFKHSVEGFLNDYMKKAAQDFDYARNTEIFRAVFSRLSEALPDGITRGRQRKSTPLNLFEAVSVGAGLAYMDTGEIHPGDIDTWMHSEQLYAYTIGATNSMPKVRSRLEFCRDRFMEQSC